MKKCPRCGSEELLKSSLYEGSFKCLNSSCPETWFQEGFSSDCDRVGEEVESQYGIVEAIDVT